MPTRSNVFDENPSLDGPDYVALVIEWDESANNPEPADCVETASIDSFPASDPPAWGSSHAAPSASTVTPERTRGRLKRLGLALLAVGAMLSFVEGMRRVRTR